MYADFGNRLYGTMNPSFTFHNIIDISFKVCPNQEIFRYKNCGSELNSVQ